MGGGRHTHIILSAPEALVPSANREGIVGKVLRLTLCPVAFASGHILITRHEQIALYMEGTRGNTWYWVWHTQSYLFSHTHFWATRCSLKYTVCTGVHSALLWQLAIANLEEYRWRNRSFETFLPKFKVKTFPHRRHAFEWISKASVAFAGAYSELCSKAITKIKRTSAPF